jgi:hypothetical protein
MRKVLRTIVTAAAIATAACSSGSGERAAAPGKNAESRRPGEDTVRPATFDIAQCDPELLWEVAVATMEAYRPKESVEKDGYIESQLFGWKQSGGQGPDEYCTLVVRLRAVDEGRSLWRLGVWAYAMQPIGERARDGTRDEWEIVGAHKDLQQKTARTIYESYLLRATSKGMTLPGEESIEAPRGARQDG